MGDNLPTVSLGTGRTARFVTVGSVHTCALLDTGTIKCWGHGAFGRLGNGDDTDRGDDPDEMGDNLPFVSLSSLVATVADATIEMTANRSSVVAGAAITYTVTVRNTGSTALTAVSVDAAINSCDRSLLPLPPQTATTYTCSHTTTAADVPQVSNLALLIDSGEGIVRLTTIARTRVDARTTRVDGQIRPGATAFIGDNTYNTTGTDQTATSTTKKKAVRYTWRTQNDGNITDTFALRGTKRTKRFTVTYKLGATNITTAVTAGTFTTTNLTPGTTTDITVTVTPTKKAKKADTLTLTLTSRSSTTPSITDTVRATTRR
jgi:hypothetical protein